MKKIKKLDLHSKNDTKRLRNNGHAFWRLKRMQGERMRNVSRNMAPNLIGQNDGAFQELVQSIAFEYGMLTKWKESGARSRMDLVPMLKLWSNF